jgi:hypothetical protein
MINEDHWALASQGRANCHWEMVRPERFARKRSLESERPLTVVDASNPMKECQDSNKEKAASNKTHRPHVFVCWWAPELG